MAKAPKTNRPPEKDIYSDTGRQQAGWVRYWKKSGYQSKPEQDCQILRNRLLAK